MKKEDKIQINGEQITEKTARKMFDNWVVEKEEYSMETWENIFIIVNKKAGYIKQSALEKAREFYKKTNTNSLTYHEYDELCSLYERAIEEIRGFNDE